MVWIELEMFVYFIQKYLFINKTRYDKSHLAKNVMLYKRLYMLNGFGNIHI